MPRTPPSSRNAALAPEATPSSDLGRVPSTTEARGTKNSVIPTPQRMNGAIMSAYGVVGVRMVASQVNPVACSARPLMTSGFPPHRSASWPTTGARTMVIAVHGRTRTPACSGE